MNDRTTERLRRERNDSIRLKFIGAAIAAIVLGFVALGVKQGYDAPSHEQLIHPAGWSQQEQDRRRAAMDQCLHALPGVEKLLPSGIAQCATSSGYYDSYGN
jgi:hypothetical protein